MLMKRVVASAYVLISALSVASGQSVTERLLDKAKDHYGKGESEAACVLLYRVQGQIEGRTKQAKQMRETVRNLLRISDPRVRKRNAIYKKAARELIVQVNLHKRKKWHALATHLAFEAEALESEVARPALASLRKVAARTVAGARRMPRPTKRVASVRKETPAWPVLDAERDAGAWKDTDGVASVRGDPRHFALRLYGRQTASECEFTVEVRCASGSGSVAVVFGAPDHDKFHLFGLHLAMNQSRVAHWVCTGEGKVSISKVGVVRMKRAERKGWIKLGVRFTRGKFAAIVGDRVALEVEATELPHGHVGISVPPGGDATVEFRNPRLGPVGGSPAVQPKGKPKDPLLVELEGVAGRLAASADTQAKEAAVLELFALRRRNVFRGNEKVRAEIGEALPELRQAPYGSRGGRERTVRVVRRVCRGRLEGDGSGDSDRCRDLLHRSGRRAPHVQVKLQGRFGRKTR